MNVLSEEEIQSALTRLPGWERDGNAIRKGFEFPDFVKAMEFVNAVAAASEDMNHHPDITIHYNRVTMTLTTHWKGGLTENDFALAARIETLHAS